MHLFCTLTKLQRIHFSVGKYVRKEHILEFIYAFVLLQCGNTNVMDYSLSICFVFRDCRRVLHDVWQL